MSLSSYKFIIFFATVYFVMWLIRIIPSKNRQTKAFVSKLLLLLASFAFVAFVNPLFCIPLLFTSIVAFVSSRLISNRGTNRKAVLIVSIIIVLLQLAVFKYFDFFSESIGTLFGVKSITLNLVAPVGISFFTFSAIGYMMDVYRNKYEAEKSFINTLLYMSFFPKLTSGPLVRANAFFSQINTEKKITLKNLEEGLQIAVCGYFKKKVLADNLSVFVDDVFSSPAAFNGASVLFAALAYTMQIYFDFSGYTDIAIGIAKMFGYDLCPNFNLPYISMNPTEFWKRWHISLSSWLQEYLYYPLGGNRKGTARTYLNLFLTMLIGGIWHGANFTFILWGTVHGIALIVHKLFMKGRKRENNNLIVKVISTLANNLFIVFTWIIFRTSSITNLRDVLTSLFNKEGITQIYTWVFVGLLFIIAEIAFAGIKQSDTTGRLQFRYVKLDLTKIPQMAVLLIAIAITLLLSYYGNTAFIYGNF